MYSIYSTILEEIFSNIFVFNFWIFCIVCNFMKLIYFCIYLKCTNFVKKRKIPIIIQYNQRLIYIICFINHLVRVVSIHILEQYRAVAI